MTINKIVSHNKESVIREYCRARKIPYTIEGGAFYVGRGKKAVFCFRMTFVPWEEVIPEINKKCVFNTDGDFESLC